MKLLTFLLLNQRAVGLNKGKQDDAKFNSSDGINVPGCQDKPESLKLLQIKC
jgi:hypothetical protein